MSSSSSDDEYDAALLDETSESSEDEAKMISGMIRDGINILERTNTSSSMSANTTRINSSSYGSGYPFINPIDNRMISMEDDDESQSSSYASIQKNHHQHRRQPNFNNIYFRLDEENLENRLGVGSSAMHSRMGSSSMINDSASYNGSMMANRSEGVISSSDEDSSSEMDESDTTEDDEEMEDEEDEENVDLREWQICYPTNTSTLYTSSNNFGSSSAPIEISHEENSFINETIFSLMAKNQKLIELIGSESPIIDYSYVLQTRSDDPTPYIPENLYTSLVYQFHQTVLFHEKIRRNYEKIIADIKLAFRDTGEEVQKIVQVVEMNQIPVPANLIPEKQGGVTKDVIAGDIRGLELMKPLSQREDPNSIMENRTKFNIDVVSAHYKNRAFTIQIRYYFPEDYYEDDLPFCIVQGAPFLTSARRKKPQRTAESKKRKKIQRLIDEKRARLQEIHGSNTAIQVPVPQSTQPVSTLEDFSNGLRELIYFVALLPQEDKQRAIDMALRTLVQNDKDI
ncbi:predicted protein [Naegleria gruberi]|uniref:Predicted protein n=1 Tax=Naegleria gruberi TaxID=5762 RepID=D2VME9_NAEGR|nr:uncharacterized protein NAEGRDRAFT_70109 [Naegleria gruberi]EFC42050.1 predicted protein [Naegleria gruberi]|eukprot:XP_002674794.1 predicted protein [Naegleria gruberi strain NEG-M]